MTALLEILNEIQSRGDGRAEDILRDAQAQCESIRREAVIKGEKIKAEQEAELNRRLKEIHNNTQKQAKLIEDTIILNEKNNIIRCIIKDYRENFINLPDEEYFKYIKALLSGCDYKGKTLYFNSGDLALFRENFAGLNVRVARESVDIGGGFILSNGEISENCSIDNLLESNRERITDALNGILFGDL